MAQSKYISEEEMLKLEGYDPEVFCYIQTPWMFPKTWIIRKVDQELLFGVIKKTLEGFADEAHRCKDTPVKP